MHNVRLLTANSMVELCTPVKDIDVSSLLQMSISLYGRQLSGLVMLVPRDPLWHSSSGSEFARVCEQSTELHFDPLPKQLQGVVESIWREESASERTKIKDGKEKISKASHDTALEVGDVYCTRHSNLRDVQACVSPGCRPMHTLPVLQSFQSGKVCGVCGGSAVGGGVTSVPHFNIHLVLPSGLEAMCTINDIAMFLQLFFISFQDQTNYRAPFAPLAARYPSAHRRALAAYDSEDESDLVAAITSVAISAVNDHTMQPDINSCELPSEHATAYLTSRRQVNHISRLAAAEVRDKYTQTGENFNLAFKMVKSDTKLVKTVLHSHGFTQCSRKNPSFNRLGVVRCNACNPDAQYSAVFPRSTELTRKDKLYDNIARSAAIFGDAFSFIPEFFVTPRDASLLETAIQHSMADSTFIVKPVSSSRGQGIFFASTVDEIPRADTLLVSRYVENPLLVNGHKFDLRIYVAVTSFYPLIIYVYSEGLTRVASEKYRSEVDSRDAFIHLTNYSINKNNSNFVRNESMASEDFGHKWTLGALLRHLEKFRIDSKSEFGSEYKVVLEAIMLMLRIEDVIIKSLLSVQTRITSACRTATPYVGTNFELFGFDILVDAELKPWLLEVNLSPSLSCDAPLDSLVKTRLICDLFNLACVPLVNRKLAGIESVRASRDDSFDSDDGELMAEKNKKVISPSKRGITTKRRRPVRNAFVTTPGGADPSMRSICRRARAEMSRRGGFVRIFPRESTLPLYRSVMERVGSEKRDERLYVKEYGLDEDTIPENEDGLAHLYHDVMMNSALYPSLESVPSRLYDILREWHSSANAYTQRITKDGETYAARLPVVRPSARLRTKSCSEWYEVKKATLAEAKSALARLPVVRPSARLRTKSCSEWYEVKKATLAEAKLKLRQEQEKLQLEEQRGRENKENASPPTVATS
ncbi:Tubulin-tyrosine ligase family protein [Ostertagia ostertagi]